MTTDIEVPTDAELAEAMNEARLGPVKKVRTYDKDGVVVVEVWLADSPIKARVLHRWVTEQIAPVAAVIGKYSSTDPVTRLTVRGTDANGLMFILVTPFRDATERRAVALLDEQISTASPARLVDRLARLEAGGPA
ncbi:hypothetical protein F1721_24910 [Saccharopolyspora hirsuta]|uniref:Uncharacterized protein n=1 Tax=Saccharopolyspora hirsuta TaxID=1837 RepID=A0A5M7BKW6_SACHI|nr:hypothetical protein [Saccharopolyspora hirsuta]KAA5829560.1 hypothetical protein F1721_24910 [Saccharopolyspora hirsuta]